MRLMRFLEFALQWLIQGTVQICSICTCLSVIQVVLDCIYLFGKEISPFRAKKRNIFDGTAKRVLR